MPELAPSRIKKLEKKMGKFAKSKRIQAARDKLVLMNTFRKIFKEGSRLERQPQVQARKQVPHVARLLHSAMDMADPRTKTLLNTSNKRRKQNVRHS